MNQLLRSSLVASCLVLLQLVTALHFALVPHGFSAGLNGFVHVHRGLTEERARAAPHESLRHAALTSGMAPCAPESCPIGFAGAHSALFGVADAGALLAHWVPVQSALPPRVTLARWQVLLSAPKTSPPAQA